MNATESIAGDFGEMDQDLVTGLTDTEKENEIQPRRKTTLTDASSISVDEHADDAWAMMERKNAELLGEEGDAASRSNITLVAEPFPVKPKRDRRKNSVGSRSGSYGSGAAVSSKSGHSETDWANIPYYEGGTQTCYSEEDEICSIALMPAFLAA